MDISPSLGSVGYAAGDVLHVHITKSSIFPLEAYIKIVKTFPFCCSCAMVVDIPTIQGGTQRAVLKLFDRRFAKGVRNVYGASPWTPKLEASYYEFVKSGGVATFAKRLKVVYDDDEDDEDDVADADDDDDDVDVSSWTSNQEEAYVKVKLDTMLLREKKVYKRLSGWQGEDIPQLFGLVRLVRDRQTWEEAGHNQWLTVRGLLLEQISGFSLEDMTEHIPRESWQAIFDDALRIVRNTHDFELFHCHMKPDHFMVAPVFENTVALEEGCVRPRVHRALSFPTSDKTIIHSGLDVADRLHLIKLGEHNSDNQIRFRCEVEQSPALMFRVVLLDFGRVITRTYETDEQWRNRKAGEKEENALALPMKTRLALHDYALRYEEERRFGYHTPEEDGHDHDRSNASESDRESSVEEGSQP